MKKRVLEDPAKISEDVDRTTRLSFNADDFHESNVQLRALSVEIAEDPSKAAKVEEPDTAPVASSAESPALSGGTVHVKDHYRHTKSGKTVWVKPHTRRK